jgi:hypothetical protein
MNLGRTQIQAFRLQQWHPHRVPSEQAIDFTAKKKKKKNNGLRLNYLLIFIIYPTKSSQTETPYG